MNPSCVKFMNLCEGSTIIKIKFLLRNKKMTQNLENFSYQIRFVYLCLQKCRIEKQVYDEVDEQGSLDGTGKSLALD